MNVVIGGNPIEIITSDVAFSRMLREQYADFIEPINNHRAAIQLTVDIQVDSPDSSAASDDPRLDDELEVRLDSGKWRLTRGDFYASYDPVTRTGSVRQSANRHSIDSVVRIIHSLSLVAQGGFLAHSASAIRHGRAWLFAGRSGAGKTTISRLAPDDVCLLSDEVSFVRQSIDPGENFLAWGTPFTGELGKPGANCCAPIQGICFLEQAQENSLTAIGKAEALRLLMTNILFFADDPELVRQVFDIAAETVEAIPMFRLCFAPDARVWDLIQ